MATKPSDYARQLTLMKNQLRAMGRCLLLPNSSEKEKERGRKLWAGASAIEEMLDEYAVLGYTHGLNDDSDLEGDDQ